MIEVAVPLRQGPLRLDVCTGCAIGLVRSPRVRAVSARQSRPIAAIARQSSLEMALAEIERINAESTADASGPDQPWEWIPGLLGLPVKENSPPLRHWPLVTWGLSLALVVIYILTAAFQTEVIKDLGLIPSHPAASRAHLRHELLPPCQSPPPDRQRLLPAHIRRQRRGRSGAGCRYVALLALSALFGDVLHVLGNLTGARPICRASVPAAESPA